MSHHANCDQDPNHSHEQGHVEHEHAHTHDDGTEHTHSHAHQAGQEESHAHSHQLSSGFVANLGPRQPLIRHSKLVCSGVGQRLNLLGTQPAAHPAPVHCNYVAGRQIGHRAVPVGPDV